MSRAEPWHRPGWRARLLAAAVSVVLVVGPLLMLQSTRLPSDALRPPVTVVLLAPAAPEDRGPLRAPSPERPPTDKNPAKLGAAPARPAPVESADTPVARADATITSPPSPAAAPASSPLRLDEQTLRRAIAGTAGAVRRMARESGAELDSPRRNPVARLGSELAAAATPDCLSADSDASLLSAPLIVVQALRGKCK